MSKIVALIVAAGRGQRAGGSTPKQYLKVGGIPVLKRSIDAYRHAAIDAIAVVIHPDDEPLYQEIAASYGEGLLPAIFGGDTRQQSVLAGLEALEAFAPDFVLIHDAARPFVDAGTIERVLASLEGGADATIAAVSQADTLKQVDEEQRVLATVPRDRLWNAQTPQGFCYSAIINAHRRAAAKQEDGFTDDASLAEWAGIAVTVVSGSPGNRKLTTAEDIALADQQYSECGGHLVPYVGTGFDVHRFGPGNHLWLCGVRIAHTHSLVGHSDADVALHALTDALLGALGDGDIGAHFPPSDPQWRGARSDIFLRDAARRAREKGGRISNVDLTLLAEAPKISLHRDDMRRSIAQILEIEVRCVGVKATTTEGLGFVGRGEGLAAMASATILLPY